MQGTKPGSANALSDVSCLHNMMPELGDQGTCATFMLPMTHFWKLFRSEHQAFRRNTARSQTYNCLDGQKALGYMGHKLVSGAQVSLVLQSRHAFNSSGLCHVPLKYLVGSGQEPDGQSVHASQKRDSLLKEGRCCPQFSSVLSSYHLSVFWVRSFVANSYLCYQLDLPISESWPRAEILQNLLSWWTRAPQVFLHGSVWGSK